MLKSVLKRQIEDGVIERWQAAYEIANGKPAPRVMRCGRGWFLAVDHSSTKRRLKDFEAFTERLLKRAQPPETVDG